MLKENPDPSSILPLREHESVTPSVVRRTSTLAHAVAVMSASPANSRAGLVADIAVSVALLHAGLTRPDLRAGSAWAAVLCGLFAFTFVEYAFHRWLFHGPVRITEQGHRKHHERSRGYDALPFFASPLMVLGLALLLACVLPTTLAMLGCGGLAAGYAAYGLSHTAIHYCRFQHSLPRRWAAAHHIHHRHPGTNFGVTSPIWDFVFGTRYSADHRKWDALPRNSKRR